MGTVVTIDVRAPFIDEAALDAAVAWFHEVDQRFSPFRDDSEVTRALVPLPLLDGSAEAVRGGVLFAAGGLRGVPVGATVN